MTDDEGSGDFVTGAECLDAAMVEPGRTSLRLLLPVLVEEGDLIQVRSAMSEARGPWQQESVTDSLLAFATGLCESWSAPPARVFPGPRGKEITLEIDLPHGRGAVRVQLASVRFFLFTTSGIGVLAVELNARDGTTLCDWLDLATGARFSSGRRALRMTIVTWERGLEQRSWLSGASSGVVGDLLASVHEDVLGRPLDQEGRSSMFMHRQLVVAGSWFVRDADPAYHDLVRYLIRSQLGATSHVGVGEEERTRRPGGRLPYALRQDFVSTLETTHFVAFDVPDTPFFRDTLPGHLDREYLLAWIFALQQRMFLIRQVAMLARDALDESPRTAAERFAEVESKAAELAQFEARGYEIHLLQREHHHRYWQSARLALEVDSLHVHVIGLIDRAIARAGAQRAEEADAESAAAQARQRDLELRVILALAIPGVLVGFAGINIRGWTSPDGSAWWIAAAILAFNLTLIGLLLWFGRRQADRG